MIALLLQASADGFVEVAAWDYVKMLLLLGAMVAGSYWLVRVAGKRQGGWGGGWNRGGPIEVLASCPLEPRKTLYLVKVGGETLLVGASESSVSLLKTLPPGAVDEQALAAEDGGPSAFLTKLTELRRRA